MGETIIHHPSCGRRRARAAVFAALLWLAAAAAAPAQGCGGVLDNACALSRVVSVPAGAAALPAQLTTCPGAADSWLQGVTLFDVPAGASVEIALTGMSADFDLLVHLPPGACVTDLQSAAYRLADQGGAAGTADECESLSPGELAAYGCGWLAVAVVCKSPGGGAFSLDVSCTPTPACGSAGSCPTVCGDCSSDGVGPNIIDALVAAQLAAGTFPPSPAQLTCCDVNASGTLQILDALLIAQRAAGLAVSLSCP